MKITTICYKLNTPKIYNESTKWETREDTLLECYCARGKEVAQMKCDELNKTATDRVYFIDEQEVFDTRG